MERYLRRFTWARSISRTIALVLGLLMALLACVSFDAHAETGETKTPPAPVLGRDISKLPPAVQHMRAAILTAATSGDIEQLRVPIDMNELHPVFSKDRIPDSITFLKSASGDGQGREMLAILYNLLTTGYAITNAGTKDEMIVWPYHAVIPLDKLTPSQEVELYRFLPPARLKEMIAKHKYSYYSVGISKEGVWHYFIAE